MDCRYNSLKTKKNVETQRAHMMLGIRDWTQDPWHSFACPTFPSTKNWSEGIDPKHQVPRPGFL